MQSNLRFNKASSRVVKKRAAKRRIAFFAKISVVPIFIFLVVLFLRADFLKVKDFEISGAVQISPEEIRKSALELISGNSYFVIPKSNILILDEKSLNNFLVNKFPRLEKIEISRDFSNGIIELNITERNNDFIWCSNNEEECFFMDKNGFVFEKIQDTLADHPGILVFKGKLGGSPIFQNFAPEGEMQSFRNIINSLSQAGFITSVIDFESPEKAIAYTDASKIIFSPDDGNFILPIQNAVLLIGETKAKDPTAKFDYIDVRFGNKVFYKLL